MNDVWDELRASPRTLVGLAALVLSYPVLLVAALVPWTWLFGAALVVSFAAEAYAARTTPQVLQVFSRLSLGVTLRYLLRQAMVIVLLARVDDRVNDIAAWVFVTFVAGVMALHAMRATHAGLTLFTTYRRRLPVVTRRIDLSKLKIPDAPPRLLVDNHVRRILNLDIAPLVGAVITAVTGFAAVALVGVAAALLATVAATATMAVHAGASRAIAGQERAMREINAQVRKHRPRVVLYFSGSLDSAYQVNMWLSTLERVRHRALVIVRERGLVPLLDRTSVPVLCVPQAINLMKLDTRDMRVALFAANAAKNVHMLRIPGIRHVFVNHGDSDKHSSFNPYAKVYDEVWVAGEAGRDRYRRARIGVRDDAIVEVGRPQLAPITRQDTSEPARMPTVLYAPTWEGYDNDPHHTSIVLMGEAIVRALLDRSPAVRVIYKPHPLTGHLDPKAKRAHERITAMITEANRARDASGEWRHETAEEAKRQAEASARLPELERRLAELTPGTASGDADEAQLSRDSGTSGSGPDPEMERCQQEWNEAYWDSQGWWRHRVITGTMPHLYECFNVCDLLVSDISSVVADFIASQKPYVVTNSAGHDDATFRAEFPTAAAGYLLGRDCTELAGILDEVADPGQDRMAQRRQELKTHLLGPDEPDAMTRFNDALDASIERAAARPPAPEDLDTPFEPDPDGVTEDTDGGGPRDERASEPAELDAESAAEIEPDQVGEPQAQKGVR